MERRAATQRAGVSDWVEGVSAAKQLREPMLRRDPLELLSGVEVRELDFDVDTIPAELTHLFR